MIPMRVLLYTHEACLLHENSPGHPERPERIGAAVAGVKDSGLEVVEFEAPRIEVEQLYSVHDPSYVAGIKRLCESGGGAIDLDTGVVPESWEAALHSAGAGVDAIGRLRAGEGDVAYLATRPPGHHAHNSQALGFCIFNNIALAIAEVTARGETVAVLDTDVHHGDGTQSMFYESEDVVYLSFHQFPFYPGTGWLEETGAGAGEGHTINIPLPEGSGGDAFAHAVDAIADPIYREFDPDWIFVSAGFDAHEDDPLAGLRYQNEDYGRVAQRLLSGRSGRVVFFLEGGYHLDSIRESTAASLRGFAGEEFEASAAPSPPGAFRMVDMAAQQAVRHWSGVQAG